eukprot:7384722-Prymnesium_polylepis.1
MSAGESRGPRCLDGRRLSVGHGAGSGTGREQGRDGQVGCGMRGGAALPLVFMGLVASGQCVAGAGRPLGGAGGRRSGTIWVGLCIVYPYHVFVEGDRARRLVALWPWMCFVFAVLHLQSETGGGGCGL